MTVWGSGKPRRELLHVADMEAACVHVMELPQETYRAHTEPMLSHINVGTGEDCTIAELAQQIAETVGFAGEILFDTSKPDGTPRKQLNVDKLRALGWQAEITLAAGLRSTYDWFLDHAAELRTE